MRTRGHERRPVPSLRGRRRPSSPSGAPATTRVWLGVRGVLAEPPCLEAVASWLWVARGLRGELSGDADGPLACALSRGLGHASGGARRAVRAPVAGRAAGDPVDAVRERSGVTRRRRRARAASGASYPLLAALQAPRRPTSAAARWSTVGTRFARTSRFFSACAFLPVHMARTLPKPRFVFFA